MEEKQEPTQEGVNRMREVRTIEAAKILNVSTLTVQCGMRCGALPIGSAWKNEGSSCWTYLISAQLLGNFLGKSREEILQEVEQIRETG